MQECLFAKDIKTDTSIEVTESEITVECEDCVNNNLLQEQTYIQDPNYVGFASANNTLCIETDVKSQLKKEIEDTVDRISDCDENIGAHYAVKQESNYDINEEIEIKNEVYFEDTIGSDHSLVPENSFQAVEGMQNGTYKLKNAEVSKKNSTKLGKLVRQNHIERSSKGQTKDFKCNLCDFITKYKPFLKDHIEKGVHLVKIYKCKDCEYSTASVREIKEHCKAGHLNRFAYRFECSLCKFNTQRKESMESHINSVHLKVKKYKCNVCNYSARQSRRLKVHTKSVHVDNDQYKCDECEYSTAWKHELRKHEKIHWETLHKCNNVEFYTASINTMEAYSTTNYQGEIVGELDFRLHELTSKQEQCNKNIKSVHLNRQYTCNYCDFSTTMASKLYQHRKTKHLKEINADFKCHQVI